MADTNLERNGVRIPCPPEDEARMVRRCIDALRDGVNGDALATRFPQRIREAARAQLRGKA